MTAPSRSDRRASRRDWSTSARAVHPPRRAAPIRGVAHWPVRARHAGWERQELQPRRAASATHGSPDVFGRWRGHGLRTDRAANLVQLRGVRYRESCPAKTVPSGKWVRTQNRAANSLQNLDRASLRRGLRHVSGVSAHQLFRCHICQGLVVDKNLRPGAGVVTSPAARPPRRGRGCGRVRAARRVRRGCRQCAAALCDRVLVL